MKLPNLEDINNEQFLKKAFDPEHNKERVRCTLIRRNIYLWLFLTGIACIFITAITHQMHMSILSLLLATISLVVMTKYDTQLFFLRNLTLREDEEAKFDEE